MKEKEIKRIKIVTNLFLIILDFFVIISLNYIMPIIQNYPPYSENNAFQRSVEVLNHFEQYLVLFIIAIFAHIISLNAMLKDVYKYLKKISKGQNVTTNETVYIRDKVARIPLKFYIIQFVIILVIGVIPTLIIISDKIAILKFLLMLFAVTSVLEVPQFIYLKYLSRKIIMKTYEKDKTYTKNVGGRISLSNNILLQIIPFLAVAVILISLIGYSKASEEKANASFNYYSNILNNEEKINDNFTSIDEIIEVLSRLNLNADNDYSFILKDDKIAYISKNEENVSDFAIKYINNFYEKTNGRSYEFYGTEKQYTMKRVLLNGEYIYAGFAYYTSDTKLIEYYLVLILLVTLVYLIMLKLWSKSITIGVRDVSSSLKEILDQDKLEEQNILPITSNDEIGDLSFYYNKIEEKMFEQQNVIKKQSELTVLGEIAGGMAHDINTPMSALRNWIELLKRKNLEEDIKVELDNMSKCADHVLNIVNSLRDQIRNIGDTNKQNISLTKVVDNVLIMTSNECIKNNCSVKTDVNSNVYIYAEENKLTQVLINFVINSAQAYGNQAKGGVINLKVKDDDEYVYIVISDNAGGLREDIEKTIFKEILTTKCTSGTGIGMYMAYSIIKGCFNGDIQVENQRGIGVKFIIKIKREETNEKNI